MAAQPANHSDVCPTCRSRWQLHNLQTMVMAAQPADYGNGCTTRGYTKIYFQKDSNSMQNYTTVK